MTDELSPRQAAERLGATTRSVQRWIATGLLPARRVGGRWRVASDAIDAFGASVTVAEGPPSAPIRTLFIANRGEIAVRITRTCSRLGIRAVVPATEGPGALDLLDANAVVRAAADAGADALHPGFGFLAESAPFAEAVIAAGIRWVGPPPEAIRADGRQGGRAAPRRDVSASRSSPATTTPTSRMRRSPRPRGGSDCRSSSSRQPAAAERACGSCETRIGLAMRSRPAVARRPRHSATTA